jgi:ubiquinone/menaquinone biosynthesis C-methylase UbiE
MATDPNTSRNYDANAENYHRHVSDPNDSTFHAYYEKPAIRAELPDLNGLEVISIGCGSGVDTSWLADHGAKKVAGTDISKGYWILQCEITLILSFMKWIWSIWTYPMPAALK